MRRVPTNPALATGFQAIAKDHRDETVRTEKGAHTLAFDAASNTVYAFLPQTHRAAVYIDGR